MELRIGCVYSCSERVIFLALLVVNSMRNSECFSTYDDSVCPDNLSVTFHQFPPYVVSANASQTQRGVIYDELFLPFFSACFGNCQVNETNVESLDELIRIIESNKTDMAMVLPGAAMNRYPLQQMEEDGSALFVKAVISPGLSVIVNVRECESISKAQIFTTLLGAWPVLAFTILLTGISGVIIWLVESRTNPEEFPISFMRGSYEGFWWAFVSMTTVGYGDKTPKTVIGRVFGVVWILAGVLLVALVTATFTSAFTVAMGGNKCKEIQGKKVAVINGSESERVASELGAILVKDRKSYNLMLEDLENNKVEAVLMDTYTAFYYLGSSDRPIDKKLGIIRSIETPLEYYSVYLTKGLGKTAVSERPFNGSESLAEKLVRCAGWHKRSGSYLRSKLNDVVREYVTPIKTMDLADGLVGLLSVDTTTTTFALYILAGMFFLVIVAGIVWDVYHKHHTRLFKISSMGEDQKSGRDSKRRQSWALNGSLASQIRSTGKSLEALAIQFREITELLEGNA